MGIETVALREDGVTFSFQGKRSKVRATKRRRMLSFSCLGH